MALFALAVGLLVLGYFSYGRLVERLFGVEPNRATPALTRTDGVDYVPMPTWKVFLIQLLDIAGIGPIFGPIMGALYGPAALLWIVLGSILAGGVHDFFSGMMSIRFDGENLPTLVGRTIGSKMRLLMLIFSLLLLILVGVVFVLSPAAVLASLFGVNQSLLVVTIFVYYFLATILPIDKIIGRLYPLFGGLLLFMTVGVLTAMIAKKPLLPDLSLHHPHPENLPLWPLLFITLSCGAVSGFHSTQSPLMSRCLTNERYGRLVFYGAMLAEGVIALVWATVGLSLYEPNALAAKINSGTASVVVNETCRSLLGSFGGALAILGVVVLPITSGDTAFRSARLIISEFIHLPQKTAPKRLAIAIPVFLVGILLSRINFSVIWRYFGWSNQMLATLVLWSAAFYLQKQNKPHWIASLPAAFLSAVTLTFIFYSPLGLHLDYRLSSALGLGGACLLLLLRIAFASRERENGQDKAGSRAF
ncbi:MAG: carbon starvation protein A [candidate division KSB1 bacterium]|nr:carbon starvation protein A [candidate division KSB1 bacterium]